jgi:hypothetical protein
MIDAFFRLIGQHIPEYVVGIAVAWAVVMASQALPWIFPEIFG